MGNTQQMDFTSGVRGDSRDEMAGSKLRSIQTIVSEEKTRVFQKGATASANAWNQEYL